MLYLCRSLAPVLFLVSTLSHAQTKEAFELDEFDWRDSRYQTKQWNQIDELARRHLGTQLKGDASDLDVLQRLIYKGAVPQDDKERLQALGVVLGTVFFFYFKVSW